MKNALRLCMAGWLVALVLLAAPIGATTYQSGKTVHITPLHEISDDFYIFGDVARVDGTIKGDLVCLGT